MINTVGELKAFLSGLPNDMLVLVSHDATLEGNYFGNASPSIQYMVKENGSYSIHNSKEPGGSLCVLL